MGETATQHTGIPSPSLSRRERNPDGWREYKFSDFVLINPRTELKSGQEYPFIEMKYLNKNRKKVYSTRMRKLKGGSRFINGDTLFARITPCLENGKICQVDKLQGKQGFGSTEFLVFREKENISYYDFIYYVAKWSEVRDFAELNMSGTSGRQRVSKTAFDELMLELPLLPEQKAIAEVLSSLDGKIDLLHRQNKTLEDIAQALFRKWFVEEADEGWEVGVIPDEFDFTMGQSPPGSSYIEENIGVPMFQGNADFGFRFPQNRIYTTEPKRFAEKFDTLISVRAPVGEQNMAKEKCCIGRGVTAFRYKKDKSFYTYAYFKIMSLMGEIRQFNQEGTVFGSISKGDIQAFRIDIPPDELVRKFQEMAKPIDDKIIFNQSQIRTLENLRDTLLPKLMSGAVRVRS